LLSLPATSVAPDKAKHACGRIGRLIAVETRQHRRLAQPRLWNRMSQLVTADIVGRETSASLSIFRQAFAKVLKYLNNN
jgi:hypothetical protein